MRRLLWFALFSSCCWAKGDLTATLAAIDADQRQPLPVNAYITINANARRDLQQAKPGPLHGWLLAIKDNIEVAGLPTTAGSLALSNYLPDSDAAIVSQLKQAGAVVLGKANLSEWANFRGQHASSGWSAVGGQTRLPMDRRRSPCGSSSGSAAAVAAGMADAAIGTETDGSITCPAAVNGLVAIKPTLGAVSNQGIVPISHQQDTAGPLAKTVDDTAKLLMAISQPGYFEQQGLPTVALGQLKVAVLQHKADFDQRVAALLTMAVQRFKKHGAKVKPVDLPDTSALGQAEFTALVAEFHHDLGAYLAGLPKTVAVHSISELVRFNQLHAEDELRYFGQQTLLMAEKAQDGSKARAQARRLARQTLDGIFAQGYDVLIAPTNGPAWLIDHINGDHYRGGTSTLAAVAGYPHVTVPMGNIANLPIGLSLIGPPGSDLRLLAIAKGWQQAHDKVALTASLSHTAAPL
ncbi:amidase family protein [Gallaecimonas mangrovi]|uniref:amidase family protein n=1 Tax=Gallaecimonas mangrovi TaxID=2291597 RepID=UPI000E1FFA2D|nr:amidase family protein [Gallaecimonas mangrovi]